MITIDKSRRNGNTKNGRALFRIIPTHRRII